MLNKFFLVVTALGFVTYLLAAMPSGYQGTPFPGDTLKGHPQHLPGDVHAVYFDEGADGVAYHYAGYFQGDCNIRQAYTGANVAMQQYMANRDFVSGTTGGINDTDVNGSHSSYLSWTSVGQWMNYTVHVDTAGTYSLQLHESVAATPNVVSVTFSGVPTDSVKNMPLSINSPGDMEIWHDWKWDNTPNTITLDTGMYVLNFTFVQGGWNFAGLRFKLVSKVTGVVSCRVNRPLSENEMSAQLVGKSLTLSYMLGRAARTKISVFDCAGRSVISDVKEDAAPGGHSLILNIGALSPGVHFARLEQNGISAVKSFFVTR
jgi:hypothetical protein